MPDKFASDEDILARVKTIPHVDIYAGQVDDDESVPLIEGTNKIKPYITVNFGGGVQAPKRFKGLCGAKEDIQEGDVVVQCVASSDTEARKLLSIVDRLILGYQPLGVNGELQPALYGGTGKISSLGAPTRYAAVQVYSYFVN